MGTLVYCPECEFTKVLPEGSIVDPFCPHCREEMEITATEDESSVLLDPDLSKDSYPILVLDGSSQGFDSIHMHVLSVLPNLTAWVYLEPPGRYAVSRLPKNFEMFVEPMVERLTREDIVR